MMINRFKDYINEGKLTHKYKLGDKIYSTFKNKLREFRVVGVNPYAVLQGVIVASDDRLHGEPFIIPDKVSTEPMGPWFKDDDSDSDTPNDPYAYKVTNGNIFLEQEWNKPKIRG